MNEIEALIRLFELTARLDEAMDRVNEIHAEMRALERQFGRRPRARTAASEFGATKQ